MKIGICGNMSLAPLADELDGIMPGHDMIVDRIDACPEELMSPSGEFARLDICIMALDWRRLAADLYAYAYGDDAGNVIAGFQTACTGIRSMIEHYRSRCCARFLLFSPLSDSRGPAGFIDRLLIPSHTELFGDCQKAFNGLCRSLADTYPVDIDEIAGRIGKDAAFDPVRWQRERRPFTVKMTRAVAAHIASICAQMRRSPPKCLVLDLDNTLWGGVVGEAGIDNLILGDTGPGLAFLEFQREIVRIHKQGVLLAICSKNNTCDALAAMESHPHMLIRPPMISCFRINWDDKTRNVAEIAVELNIGLDAMMFIDDSPVERDMMRHVLPDVEILDLPGEPACFAETLRKCTRFWPLQITGDDIKRRMLYSRERQRIASKRLSANVEEYLASLEIRVRIANADGDSLPRVTQLINKVNQFNLTGKRYPQSELEAMLKKDGRHLFSMEMTDKFGEYGVIGAALIIDDAIDSLLMSCRVFGKQVENALLAEVLGFLRETGLQKATGHYIRTIRNSMVKDFYRNAGFYLLRETVDGSVWQFDLRNEIKKGPYWINADTFNLASERPALCASH